MESFACLSFPTFLFLYFDGSSYRICMAKLYKLLNIFLVFHKQTYFPSGEILSLHTHKMCGCFSLPHLVNTLTPILYNYIYMSFQGENDHAKWWSLTNM